MGLQSTHKPEKPIQNMELQEKKKKEKKGVGKLSHKIPINSRLKAT